MSFRSVFIAVVVSTALLVAAFMVHSVRPRAITGQPTPALVRASGKCASCHINQQFSVVHEYELSAHAQRRINCLDCHQPADGQEKHDHHGFVITMRLTAANCRSCHERVYQQFLRSRHAAPSWAAVYGSEPFRDEQIDHSERFHPGGCRRAANALVGIEGGPAAASGCAKCHAIGKPNADGTIGTCTACHTRHTSSVEIARLPSTCGQCHMGPDHSQLEIYTESKHGVLFEAQRKLLNLAADPNNLTSRDMFVPTCSTCHMSGLNGANVTHDTSERLSYHLAAEVSDKRPNFAQAQANMKDICLNCHTRRVVDQVYGEAEAVVASTNEKVLAVKSIVDGLRTDGLLEKKPFAHPIDFNYFDLWHYDGRTSKHGAFMGGADFVQWHGNYPLLKHTVEIEAAARELRKADGESR
jgi:nitrate/TMAO reductase-like tetraheme cytochrome c subunit